MKRMVGLGMLMERREVLSLHSVACAEDGTAVWLTYKLLEAGGRYGVLCYREMFFAAGSRRSGCCGGWRGGRWPRRTWRT